MKELMKVVHIYNQDLKHDVRTRRYGNAITAAFPGVHFLLIGQKRADGIRPSEFLGDRFEVARKGGLSAQAFRSKGIVDFSCWIARVFFFTLRQKNIKVISAHSLKVLPVAALLAVLKRVPLVYDTHEIETHTTSNSAFIRVLSLLERMCLPKVAQLIVTSPGHKAWYEKRYRRAVTLIRNCPSLNERPEGTPPPEYDLKKKLDIPPDHLLFIYIGIINPARGTDVILDAFKKADADKHILFLGYGDTGSVERAVREYPNIYYLPPVPPLELVYYLATADAGIHMMDSGNLNHRNALPNKPMQYMAAGLPCIVSDLEVMGELISGAGSGWVIREGDDVALAALVNSLDRVALRPYAENASRWFNSNNWESESQKLVDIYKIILN